MNLILLRSVPRRNESRRPREEDSAADSRLITMDEVRRRWEKKQAVRRALLSYTPEPA